MTAKAFQVVVDDGPPRSFNLRAGQVLRVGRDQGCEIVIDRQKDKVSGQRIGVSGHHLDLFVRMGSHDELQLCARDVSTNGTGLLVHTNGVREITASDGKMGAVTDFGEFGALTTNKVYALKKAATLLIPFRMGNLPRPSPNLAGHVRINLKFSSADAPRCGVPNSTEAVGSRSGLPDEWDRKTRRGRWRYGKCIGEGGLGVIYKATDMTGHLGTVAIKCSKWTGAPQDAWHVYIMHREASWSRRWLHNEEDPRYDPNLSRLFVRYLEDHTSFPGYCSDEFDSIRRYYEHPKFNWAEHKFDPPLATEPYVVMDLAPGQPLSSVIERDDLTSKETRCILAQAAQALEYLARFNVAHRDFRGVNMHLAGRGDYCRLHVLDLGLLVSQGEDWGIENSNPAICTGWGVWAKLGQKCHDWVPPEVKIPPYPNFAMPAHSFDMFSFGVLVLRLLLGKAEARTLLVSKVLDGRDWTVGGCSEVGVGQALLRETLALSPEARPTPRKVADEVFLSMVHALVNEYGSRLCGDVNAKLQKGAKPRGLYAELCRRCGVTPGPEIPRPGLPDPPDDSDSYSDGSLSIESLDALVPKDPPPPLPPSMEPPPPLPPSMEPPPPLPPSTEPPPPPAPPSIYTPAAANGARDTSMNTKTVTPGNAARSTRVSDRSRSRERKKQEERRLRWAKFKSG